MNHSEALLSIVASSSGLIFTTAHLNAMPIAGQSLRQNQLKLPLIGVACIAARATSHHLPMGATGHLSRGYRKRPDLLLVYCLW